MESSKNITAQDLIFGYKNGIFPMAEATGEIYWYSPNPRAIIPISEYKPQKSLRPILNQNRFETRIDTNFEEVIRSCSLPRKLEKETWISENIINAYVELYRLGLAHSVESYQDNKLVGGLYGVALGSAFFGESMFYKVKNASKVAFHYLIEILKVNNFQLLDSQFINDNVKRFGAVELPQNQFLLLLKNALSNPANFIEPGFEHFYSKNK